MKGQLTRPVSIQGLLPLAPLLGAKGLMVGFVCWELSIVALRGLLASGPVRKVGQSAPLLKVMVNRRKGESTLGSRSKVPRFQEAGAPSGPLCEPVNSDRG